MFAADEKLGFSRLRFRPAAFLTVAALSLAGTAAGGQAGVTPLAHAKELEAAGFFSRALNTAVTALKATPSDKDLYLYTLELLPETPSGQLEAFKALTARAISTEKNYYGYYLGICKLQRSSGEIMGALSNCRKALELDATPYPVYRELGLTWERAGNKAKAEEILSQGVELSSGNYKAYLNRAGVREKFGETKTALADYIKALDLLKKDQSYRGNRQAISKWDGCLETTPGEGKCPPLEESASGAEASAIKTKIKKLLQQETAARALAPERPLKAVKADARPSDSPIKTANHEKCAQDFRFQFAAGNLEAAERSSAACLKLAPADPVLRKDRAGLLVRLGRYEDAVEEYDRAAELYKKQPMAAFCLAKMAETLIKLGRGIDAEKAYKTALKTYPADLNLLNGLARLFETRGDLKSASGVYEKILSSEPANAGARLRLAEIEAGLLTPEQAFSALKERQAVDPKKVSPTAQDLKLFRDITAAERNGAVDYLKKKRPALNRLVLEKQSATGPKLLLTGAGYRLYLHYLSGDAVAFFEGKSINLRDIFALRNNSGAPLFDKAGKLTAEGDAALRLAGSGRKSWLLAHEAVPESPPAEKANKEIEAAQGRGYREISEPEYLWLMKATDCPPEVLKEEPINIIALNDGARDRYLLCYLPFPAACSNSINEILPPYIEKYRSGNNEIPDSDFSTAFFGVGAVKRRRFCEDGKIWMGTQKIR